MIALVVRASMVLFVFLGVVTLVACDGDGDGGTTIPTPTSTQSSTPTPDPTVEPMAAEPVPPDGATPVTEGRRRASLMPGGSLDLDAVEVAVEAGDTAPPCAALVASWTWAALAAGGATADVAVTATRMGLESTLAEGAEGAVPSGCAFLRFENRGEAPIEIEVRFVIATLVRN